jgi:hypothetical protein
VRIEVTGRSIGTDYQRRNMAEGREGEPKGIVVDSLGMVGERRAKDRQRWTTFSHQTGKNILLHPSSPTVT